jgi:hypothetical protein
VASTKRARDRIRNTEMIRELPSGAVSGIPALLLNEGIVKKFDVIVLLGKTIQDTSEFGPAASASEAIMRLVPGLSCDTGSLLTKVQTFEQNSRRVRSDRKDSAIKLVFSFTFAFSFPPIDLLPTVRAKSRLDLIPPLIIHYINLYCRILRYKN